MFKRLFIIPAILFPLLLFSQDMKIEPINFKKIRKEIKKKKSPYFYSSLYQRYLELDTSLTITDFRYLYYGYTFQKEYSPYGTPRLQDSLATYLSRKDPLRAEFEVAARLAGELLKESSFRLRETFIAALSYEMAGNEHMSSLYFNFYEKQVDAIMTSGDGLSKKTAFVVIYIPDEYEMLEVLGFRFANIQQLLDDDYDLLKVEENPYGVSEIYFDVRRMIEVEF